MTHPVLRQHYSSRNTTTPEIYTTAIPSAYPTAALSSHFGALEAAAEGNGNHDAAFVHIQKAKKNSFANTAEEEQDSDDSDIVSKGEIARQGIQAHRHVASSA